MDTESAFENASGGVDRDKILGAAKGDSVVESLLFRTMYHPELDEQDDGGILRERIPGILLRLFRVQRGFSVLNRPVIDFLDEGEQPHFMFYSTNPIEVFSEGEREEYAPASSRWRSLQHLALAVVTDRRILFLVGQGDDDKHASCSYSEIDAVYFNGEVDDPYFSVHAGSRYTIRDCQPAIELADAAQHVNQPSVTVEESFSETGSSGSGANTSWWSTVQGQTSDVARRFGERIDSKHLLRCGVEGASKGRKVAGGKGAAVGFTLGAGYSIYVCMAEADVVNAPNPEDIAETATNWQEKAANATDEKVEWMAVSLGVAQEFASANNDSTVAAVLSEVSPELGVKALEQGTNLVSSHGVSTERLPVDTELFDSFPITHLRQSTTEFERTVTELLDADLLDDLTDVPRGFDLEGV